MEGWRRKKIRTSNSTKHSIREYTITILMALSLNPNFDNFIFSHFDKKEVS